MDLLWVVMLDFLGKSRGADIKNTSRLHEGILGRHRLPKATCQNDQQQDRNRGKNQCGVVKNIAPKLGFALTPVAQLCTVFQADLIQMFQIPHKIVRRGIAVPRILFQGVEN
jgi:hypothetical protein